MPLVNTDYSSPNHSDRGGRAVRLIVLHATVGPLQSSLEWLCNPKSEVSTHYLISKTGRIFRLVDESRAAWHAGRSNWRGETKVNEISIGVELENLTGMKDRQGRLLFKGQDPYPEPQVRAATELTRDLLTRHKLHALHVERHADVAMPRGRKSDPLGFPFHQWRLALDTYTYRHIIVPSPIFEAPDPRARIAIQIDERPTADSWLPAGVTVPCDAEVSGFWHLVDGRGFICAGCTEPI